MPTDPPPGQDSPLPASAATVERSAAGMLSIVANAGATRESLLALFDAAWERLARITYAGQQSPENRSTTCAQQTL